MEELKHKAGPWVAEKLIILEIATTLQLTLPLYYKMFCAASSGLVLIVLFLRRHFLPSSSLLVSLLLPDSSKISYI